MQILRCILDTTLLPSGDHHQEQHRSSTRSPPQALASHLTASRRSPPTGENEVCGSQQEPGCVERRRSADGAVQGATVAGHRVAAGGDRARRARRFPRTAAPGRRPPRCRTGRPARLRASGRRSRRCWRGVRRRRGAARRARDPLTDRRAAQAGRCGRRGRPGEPPPAPWFIEGLEAAVGECGEPAGDQLRDVAGTGGDGDQGALGQSVVERGRGGRVGVSRARRSGAGGEHRAADTPRSAGRRPSPP